MEPARFVSYGLVYAGALLVAQSVLFADPFALGFPGVFTLLMGVIFLVGGLHRRRSPDVAETQPREYGALTYGFALLLVALTVLSGVLLLI